MERLTAAGLLLVSVALLVIFSGPALRSWRVYAGTGQRRQRDATGEAIPVPASVQEREARLRACGYTEIGKTSLQLPQRVAYSWILASEDARSYAIVVTTSQLGMTAFYSAWADGTWIGTSHPIGATIDSGGLQLRVVPTTLEDAAAVHRERLAAMMRVHGEPRAVRAMPDLLALDDDYRRRFGGSELRPRLLRIVLPALLAAAGVVLSLVLLATMP